MQTREKKKKKTVADREDKEELVATGDKLAADKKEISADQMSGELMSAPCWYKRSREPTRENRSVPKGNLVASTAVPRKSVPTPYRVNSGREVGRRMGIPSQLGTGPLSGEGDPPDLEKTKPNQITARALRLAVIGALISYKSLLPFFQSFSFEPA
jgi:hypothetical protein